VMQLYPSALQVPDAWRSTIARRPRLADDENLCSSGSGKGEA
jgi:hypothetical protein